MSMTGNVTDEVKQRVDIVELVGRYSPLKRAGTVYKGLCPFHSERTPSFVVFPHTGTWHCFGACGTGGDAISFVMRKENLDFREALQLLAQQVGIEIDEHGEDPSGRQRTQLYDVNEAAALYFAHVLQHHPAAEPARAYLRRRGIDQPVADRFHLGFALDTWSGLRDYLLEKGFKPDLLLEAGLIKRNEERNSTYDMFRNRVIFPIRDRQGRSIGFGGRVLDDSLPKYLNTSETPLFHKSHVIYGLDLANRAIRQLDRVVIVEGYMDVIAAHQFGFANVVACMGTALTPDQLRQLQHYTDNFVLALDADAAGQQATMRGLNQARQSLTRVRKPVVTPAGNVRLEERLGANLFITTMPEGRDPDDVIRQDPTQWQAAIDAAKPLVDFYFDVVAAQTDLSSARGKGVAVAELTPLIAELGDDVERQHYTQRLSRLVQVDELTIAGRVQAAARTMQAGIDAKRPRPADERPAGSRRKSEDSGQVGESRPAATVERIDQGEPAAGRLDFEDHLLANLISDGNLLVWLASAGERLNLTPVNVDDWQNVENREIFRSLRLYLSGDEPWDVELFQETLVSQLHGRLGRLMAYAAQLPQNNPLLLREDAIKVLLRMRMERLRSETTHIRYLLDEMQRAGERDAIRSFDKINNQNLRELSHLQQVMARLPQVLFQRQRADVGAKTY